MGCLKLTYEYQEGLEKNASLFFGESLRKNDEQQNFCTNYTPFGLTFNSYTRTASTAQNFLYQGKELQAEVDSSLYDFHARQFDAAIGRFTSVDPQNQFMSGYVGMGNNPVMGVDPDGEWVHIVIGAVIGGAINLGIKAYQGDINSWGDGFAAFGIGAAAGAVGAATGGAAFLAAGGGAAGAGGFAAGAVGGMVGSAASMPIQSAGNSLYFGDPFMTAEQYGIGILAGGLIGGTLNGINASAHGKGFWKGNPLNQGPTPVGPAIQPKGIDSPKPADVKTPQSLKRLELNNNPQAPRPTTAATNDPLRANGMRIGQGDFAGKNITTRDLYLNPGKQGRHIVGHKAYQSGKSILSADPQHLVNQLNNGNFTPVGVTRGGMPIVKFNFNIGTAINLSGNQGLTSYGAVHVGRGGIHIVPIPFP